MVATLGSDPELRRWDLHRLAPPPSQLCWLGRSWTHHPAGQARVAPPRAHLGRITFAACAWPIRLISSVRTHPLGPAPGDLPASRVKWAPSQPCWLGFHSAQASPSPPGTTATPGPRRLHSRRYSVGISEPAATRGAHAQRTSPRTYPSGVSTT